MKSRSDTLSRSWTKPPTVWYSEMYWLANWFAPPTVFWPGGRSVAVRATVSPRSDVYRKPSVLPSDSDPFRSSACVAVTSLLICRESRTGLLTRPGSPADVDRAGWKYLLSWR